MAAGSAGFFGVGVHPLHPGVVKVLVEEDVQLVRRGVVVVDKNDKVTYVEYVPEVTHAINFDGVLAAVKGLL